jgi:ubiquitin-conjugating enzyme E2 Q
MANFIIDVSDYPTSHSFHIFVADDNAPSQVGATLNRLPNTMGMPLPQLMEIVSKAFSPAPDGDLEMVDSQYDEEGAEEEYSDEEEEEEEGEDFYGGDGAATSGGIPTVATTSHRTNSTSEFRSRIRSDLNHAKAAGFKIGHHGELLEGSSSYISVSCRISKLGISEEAMQAWQLEASDYLILLIFYPNGYKSIESIKGYDASNARRNVEFRVGVSHTYKPTLKECHAAFTKLSSEEEARAEMLQAKADATVGTPRGLRNTFISRPLNDLLNERLPTIVKYRYIGMHWTGAEEFYNDHQGKTFTMTGDDYMDSKYMNEEPVQPVLPRLVMNDHLNDQEPHSFPLLGMQFLLRHFVRCTEFCLVCHCKLQDDLEALKPYVCEKPLCLYQYMSLGFGPSIEHEIISQPYVVDLLISFCYQSALGGRLNSFPSGLSLSVPNPVLFNEYQTSQAGYSAYQPQALVTPAVTPGPQLSGSHKAKFDRVSREILFEKGIKIPVKLGDWIVVQPVSPEQPFEHCRVIETHMFPVVKVTAGVIKPSPDSETAVSAPYSIIPAIVSKAKPSTPVIAPKPSHGFEEATFYIYDVNFDDLVDTQKRGAIVAQLDLLPGVVEIKEYLTRNRMATLANWSDRISPTQSGILRWIIASNRACIVQVDNPDQYDKKGEARLPGMEGWMQFRFAMGAPDKERRFISSVQETRDRLKLNHPTLFAWHGSPLANWHGIIREGLHFRDALHGRAYGNGVYHSLDFNTSQGYSGMGHYRGTGYGPSSWPSSELKVSVALALNEIVNAPGEYVSRAPHLVVAQLDWIQTRYLFVQCNGQVKPGESSSTSSVQFHDQDPSMTPMGPKGKIVIPLDAMPKSRRGGKAINVGKGKGKKKLKATGSAFDPISLDLDDDDAASITTDVEDLNILIEDENEYVAAPTPFAQPTGKGKETRLLGGLKSFMSKATKSSKPLTDFIPGQLDFDHLPLLEPPVWATTSATQRLQKEYQTLIKVQATHPLHELGWYTDPEKLDNVYQWIIELHSFEEDLPLAKQMKQKGMKSVVIEMRFGKDYPMAPPFIRVIRPRFLSFMQGGGGHVTAGGSICMEVSRTNPSKTHKDII